MSKKSQKKIQQSIKQADELRFASRSFAYVARALALIVAGVTLCVLAFITCARLANTYILVNEGMAFRAECILQEGSQTELLNYFTADCAASDGRLGDESYKSFTVNSYSYSLSFNSLGVWPWRSTITVDVTEQVEDITGSANTNADPALTAPPAWTPIRYKLVLVKVDGSWRINSISTIEVDPDIEPSATYDPEKSPLPMATATPVPSPTPEGSVLPG